MRRERALEELERLRQYFADIPSYQLSKQNREELQIDDSYGLTYGETSVNLSTSLMSWSRLKPDDVFCDFGSGVGIPTLVASIFCKEAHGVEILPELVKVSLQARDDLGYDNAFFAEGDFSTWDMSSITFLFAYSTCFPRELMQVFQAKALELQPGARVLITNHELQHEELQQEKSELWTWKDKGDDWAMPTYARLYTRL